MTFLKDFESRSRIQVCSYTFRKANEKLVRAVKESGDFSLEGRGLTRC